jgi:hypothetical protein
LDTRIIQTYYVASHSEARRGGAGRGGRVILKHITQTGCEGVKANTYERGDES